MASRLISVEVRGFRAFGTEPSVLSLDAPLTIVHAGNSQGKTSFAEAIEFLISGRSSRRELLGGAKAEYNDSLRNAHLPGADRCVYVEALVRTDDGETRSVRRELVGDFGQGAECESRLLIDGSPAADLSSVGIPIADPPVRAPVLLQHILRHALATEPKQRVGYFKALLALTDLDLLRERVAVVRGDIERESPGSCLALVGALTATPAASAGATLTSLADDWDSTDMPDRVDAALLDAGAAILNQSTTTLDELAAAIRNRVEMEREQAFPLASFAIAGPMPSVPVRPGTEAFEVALAEADLAAARVAPLLTAVLAVHEYASLDQPVDCPVCGSKSALTPGRLLELHEQLKLTQAVDSAARSAADDVNNARNGVHRTATSAVALVPPVAAWTDGQAAAAAKRLTELGVDPALAAAARQSARDIAAASTRVQQAATALGDALDRAAAAISARQSPPGHTFADAKLEATLNELGGCVAAHLTAFGALHEAVRPAIRERMGLLHE